MRDFVKATLDVAFENPLRRCSTRENVTALFNRVGHRPGFPKAIGVRITGRFGDGFEGQQVQRLMRAILHRRYSERTQFSVPFGNESAFKGLRLVIFCRESGDGLRFLLRRVELLSVHPSRAPARILCHASNSEATCAVGAGENELQSADFALLVLLLRFYDSSLQATHVAIGSLPVDGMPVKGWTQARASSPVRGGFKFSTNSCSLRRRHRDS